MAFYKYKYKIVKSTSVERAEFIVSKYINNGWDVVGGLATAPYNSDEVIYSQALVKRFVVPVPNEDPDYDE